MPRKPTKRMPRRRRANAGRQYRRRYVRNARARPMRALRTNYRAINKYRFVRETADITLAPTLIPAPAGQVGNMAYFNFNNITITDLVNWTEYQNLFASYIIDKIETYLVPMFTSTENIGVIGNNPAESYQLMVTRINTKYLNEPFQISADAEEQRDVLAQIQSKSRSLYATKKWLKLVSYNPKPREILSTQAGNNPANDYSQLSRKRWMSTTGDAANQVFQHNQIVFFDRLDGNAIQASQLNYRVWTRITFRVSQVA